MLVNTYHIAKNGHVSEMTLKPHTPPTTAKQISDEPTPDLFAHVFSQSFLWIS